MKFIDKGFGFDLKLRALVIYETKIGDDNKFNLIFGTCLFYFGTLIEVVT